MTQRTRLPDQTEVCDFCRERSMCRRIRIPQVIGIFTVCAPCLSVLNGPLEAPVFTGIDASGAKVEYQKRDGKVYSRHAVSGNWRLVYIDSTPSQVRAIADALDSQEGT
jgi:hypothetical protein